MPKKSVRHIKIREIISNEQIETQDELVKRLNDYDLNVTQATVLVILKNYNLLKYLYLQVNMFIVYQMIENSILSEKLERYLMDSFVNIRWY